MRIRQVTILCILFALVLALAAGSAMAQAGAKPAPAAKTAAGGPAPSLVSISAGAVIVVHPKIYGGWPDYNILDESPRSGWATPRAWFPPRPSSSRCPRRLS